jgi:ATP-dependent protease HslVU (ClpYQ) peptidase subunit
MDNMIDKILKQSEDQMLLETYRKRVEENKDWHRKRVIKDFKVGMTLDVQNKDYIWLVGVVKKIIIRAKNYMFLIIGYRVSHFNKLTLRDSQQCMMKKL